MAEELVEIRLMNGQSLGTCFDKELNLMLLLRWAKDWLQCNTAEDAIFGAHTYGHCGV